MPVANDRIASDLPGRIRVRLDRAWTASTRAGGVEIRARRRAGAPAGGSQNWPRKARSLAMLAGAPPGYLRNATTKLRTLVRCDRYASGVRSVT